MNSSQKQDKPPRKIILGPRYRVVVVGANFSGLKAASALSDDFKVTVIDPGPYFEFLPNIHELLSGVKTPGNLRLPRKTLIRGFGHRFLQDFVEKIDPDQNKVITAGGKRIYYDFCIVAVGGVNNLRGVAGAGKYALPFKSVDDCRKIGKTLKNGAESGSAFSTVIVGGGLEGVEALGEILRKFKHVSGFSIALVEQSETLLPGFTAAVDKEIRRLCKNLNVNFKTGESVEEVTRNNVILKSGEVIDSDVTIWTGGATAPPLLEKSGLTTAKGDWAPVDSSCRSVSTENVFVVGDAAALPSPVSKQAYYAMDMGVLAAGNIYRTVNGERLFDFKKYSRPGVVTFGDLSSFFILDGIALAGSALAAAKESIYQLNMAKLDRPVRLGAYVDAFGRLQSGATGFVFPTLTSFSALKRLGNVKVLF